jgi:hypothetical protein
MRPTKHKTTGSNDLFRAWLDQIINLKHELVLLAGKIDPCLDRAFGSMTVPDNTVSSISKPEVLHLSKKRLGFQLDRLRQQLSRTRSKDIGQGIIDLVGLTKTNNIAILIHGVSLSLRGSGRLDTRLDTAYLTPSSPRFRLSSRCAIPGRTSRSACRRHTTHPTSVAR